jgi:serine phosphatase RsbU (regulator of sigma subunit)
MNLLSHYWNKISTLGLKENETLLECRSVILMNRLLMVIHLILICYLPIEIIFNGFELIPLVLLLMVLISIPFYFQKKRWFNLSRYYIFIISILYVSIMGLLVGKTVGNYVTLISAVMIGIVIFPKKHQKIISFVFILIIYVIQNYLFTVLEPEIIVTLESAKKFEFIFFILAMLLNFILGYHSSNINFEFENIITKQNKDLAIKNNEITDSINYARRIQKAILPPENKLKSFFDEMFVLYLPKDIIAGDFYWLEKKDDFIYFAVADCTGHGVPGAMVSVICNNALNRSLFEFNIIYPADILNKCRDIIIKEFEGSDEIIKDGMDISLGALNLKNLKLYWSGAHNPLVVIRNEEWIEYKANKFPVGFYVENLPFVQHEIELKKDDLIYLFSDGYIDQFGGERGKKLKMKAFKGIIMQHHQQAVSIQKEMLKESFENWKNNYEQIDDVCVMGIKV